MDDVVVGILHVVTFVGGDDSKICHHTKLSSKWERFLMGRWMSDTDTAMIVNPGSIIIGIIAATMFGEHLGLGQITKTSLVYLAPINNRNWGMVHW